MATSPSYAQAQLPSDLLEPTPVLASEGLTPLMTQYLAIKAQHSDCLVFFRLGDFYELFFDDAVKASRALDIALTRRGQMQGQDVPMCGVPAHAYENYLAKLIRKGFRVAICEQSETPEQAKKRGAKSIVARDVVRIITPGTLTEDSLLDQGAANYLACLASVGDQLALGWIDLVAGKPYSEPAALSDLGAVFARIDACEILVPQKLIERPDLFDILAPWKDRLVPQPDSRFDSDNARRRLQGLYGVTELAAFGDFTRAEVAALGALLDYVQLTQKSDLGHLSRPQKMLESQTVAIDPSTRRNLELSRTLSGERQGSLLAAIDRTMTGAGARLLGARLAAPLTDIAAIAARLESVAYLVAAKPLRDRLRMALRQTPDLERSLARLALGRGGPRDLAAVRDALRQAETMRSLLLAEGKRPAELQQITQKLGEQNALIDKLSRALASDLPMLARDGNFIARGYAVPLDELVMLRDDSRRLIAAMQQKYADSSGVAALKIRHNNVIGYYIEVTPLHADKLLAQKESFIHRQSLASAVRFTTVELSEMERKITEAAGKALAIELQLFDALVVDVAQQLQPLRATAEAMAMLDVAAALAELAVEQNYARPLVDDTLTFTITGGRHPVVEQALKQMRAETTFIANDCSLIPDQRLWLLTGPNMAGKSTFLRQNALIALLAQMGSFVPAVAAHIGVVDRLFSRVGAADDLARGQSTFMVEMVETAAILNQAGPRALVILDEIGRGTATYDGLSIAWATLEHLHDVNHCRALFATHYHELTGLANRLAALSCHTMKIKEWDNSIMFLHQVIPGVADRSYGIHVGQMAGLPATVVTRAEQVLKQLESDLPDGKRGNVKSGLENLPLFQMSSQIVAVSKQLEAKAAKPEKSKLDLYLEQMRPDDLSPKQALEALYHIKGLIDVTL